MAEIQKQNNDSKKIQPKGPSPWNTAGTWEERKLDVDSFVNYLNENKGKLISSSRF